MIKKHKILFVDDDPNILAAYKRHLRNAFQVETAGEGQQGLEAITSSGPFAVIVSDYHMPVMNGIEFLSRAKELAPDTARIMLTGHADLEIAMDAVNEGNIFRLLTKPCKPPVLATAIEAGVRQYQLVQKERELTESKRIQAVLQKARDKLKELVEERTRELMTSNEKLREEVEERKRAEQSMRRSQRILQLVMDNIPQCIFWKDADSRYLGCNRNFARLMGFSEPEEIIGKSDAELKWVDAELLREYGIRVMETNVPEFEMIEQFQEVEGRTVYLDTATIPYHNEKGEVIGVIGTIEDISEKIESEEALIRREKSQSMAKVAKALQNELSDPIMALAVIDEVIHNTDPKNPLYAFLTNAREQVEKLNVTVEKLRKIAG